MTMSYGTEKDATKITFVSTVSFCKKYIEILSNRKAANNYLSATSQKNTLWHLSLKSLVGVWLFGK